MTQRATALPEAGPYNLNRGDAIDSWLGMFTRFLRLPHEQSRAIKDELDSHMRERVRDLMLEGLSEDEGMRRAIDELGEAAELAAHFRAAHQPNRRLLMSIAAIGVAAGAAVISVVALNQAGQPAAQPAPSATADTQPRTVHSVPVLSDIPVLSTLFAPSNVSPAIAAAGAGTQVTPGVKVNLAAGNHQLRSVLELLARESGKKLVLPPATELDQQAMLENFELVASDVPGAVRRINRVMGLEGDARLDLRQRPEVIEVARVRDFDKDETTLVAYDLTDAFNRGANNDALSAAITGFVEPNGWHENGGTTAKLMVVGTRLFVEAPPRYHEGVAWMLGQFARKPGARTADNPFPQQQDQTLAYAATLKRVDVLEREIAWAKASLAMELSDAEKSKLDDRAVKAVENNPAATNAAKARLEDLAAELEAHRQRLTSTTQGQVKATGGR